ncbi:MAG: AMP-binding protein [Comamonadaceae bacterium]|nr:AMP-binding protein [Comamonadaceae bacterium]
MPRARRLADHHDLMHRHLRWKVDAHFNIAQVCSQRWASSTPDAPAIVEHRQGQAPRSYTYGQLQRAADALSLVLEGLGVMPGDRVAIVLPQRFETAVAYMALLQMGAVAMPLSVLFGPDALEYRLQDSGAVAAIADGQAMATLQSVRANCAALRHLIGVDGCGGDVDFGLALGDVERVQGRQGGRFEPVSTQAHEAAVLIYTSGTTGPPKGALIPHQALIGNLTGFVCSQNWFGFDGVDNTRSQAIFWSPADWAWTGGLMDALLPTLYFGRPIVACAERFGAEMAFDLMQQHGVTHTFLFPTALKAMMKTCPQPRTQYRLKLQAIMSAGEAVGDAVYAYCRDRLGVVVNEMFGQTEINYIVGNCAMQWAPGGQGEPVPGRPGLALGWPARPGSMGKPYPGHRVAVIDENGRECPVGVSGDVALHRLDVHGQPDPIFFLGYWKNEAATESKFTGPWCRTGDLARCDEDGYLWYEGRSDDVFKAAGYRIGPGEIENCLVKHPAVANAAVVPKPDRERGALVKAYVVLSADYQARRPKGAAQAVFDAQVTAALQAHVRGLLAPYEYPKEVEFIDQLPMTTTGKVQRRILRLQEQERFRASTG